MPLLTISMLLGVALARWYPAPVEPNLTKRALWLCPPLIGAAFVQSVVIREVPVGWRANLVISTTVVAIVWTLGTVLAFRRSPVRLGVAFFAVGACMNLLPILEHGYMPVDRDAVVAAGLPMVDDIGRGHPAKHAIVDSEDVPFFGDRIAIRPLLMVASIGDLVQMVGVTLVVRAVWPRRQPKPSPASPAVP